MTNPDMTNPDMATPDMTKGRDLPRPFAYRYDYLLPKAAGRFSTKAFMPSF